MKDELTCKCGKVFKPQYRNEILVSKSCPNCRLKSLYKPKGVKMASELNKVPVSREKHTKTKPKIDKRLDTAWSKLIKLKSGGKCAVCGTDRSLNSHHIYSRAKMSLRWSVNNGICLCVNHHIGVKFSAHKTPIEFNDWMINKFGSELMDELKIMAHTSSNLHEFEKSILLMELNSEIKKLSV